MVERYHTVKRFFQQRFPGYPVRKLPLNAGMGCPNRDGSLDTEGCIFCDIYGSGPIADRPPPVRQQIQAKLRSHSRTRWLAYFQAFSNTYAPPARLREIYATALDFPDIVGISVGTRPDCLPPAVLDVLEEVSRRTYLCVELGLQSIHDTSLRLLNRHHDRAAFLQAFQALKQRGIDVVVHLILGIPGETRTMMMETVQTVSRLKPAGVKFHMLHVLRNTVLEKLYHAGRVTLFAPKEYVRLVVDLLEHLDGDVVVHRLTGERQKELYVAPRWGLDKARILQNIQKEMETRDTRQGRRTTNPYFPGSD